MGNADSINLIAIRANIATLIHVYAISEQFKLGLVDKERYSKLLKDVTNACMMEQNTLTKYLEQMSQNLQGLL